MTQNREPDPAEDVVRCAVALNEEHGLSALKGWKAAHPGQLAIGHLPIFVPRPLLEAMGCLPVAVFGAGEKEIVRGDSYFQSYICHIPRSTIELGLAGALADLDGIIFPAICDVIRNLSGMWQMLFPQVYTTYLDLPQNFRREVGGVFYRRELERISIELVARGATPWSTDSLRQAIRDENERRAALQRLSVIRHREPWRVPASEAYLVTRAGGALFAAEHRKLLEAYLDAVPKRPSFTRDNVRVVLTGAFCEQPPLMLIRSLERAGCDIVEDDLQLGLTYLEGAIEEDAADPMDALVRAFLEKGAATASRYIGNDEKGADLVRRVRRANADGVIFAAASFCDPALLDQPMLEAALESAGIPFTSFKFAENTGQFQVIREQAGAFSDAVRLWEVAP
jgi:benzoyl-CoA reductase subunit C